MSAFPSPSVMSGRGKMMNALGVTWSRTRTHTRPTFNCFFHKPVQKVFTPLRHLRFIEPAPIRIRVRVRICSAPIYLGHGIVQSHVTPVITADVERMESVAKRDISVQNWLRCLKKKKRERTVNILLKILGIIFDALIANIVQRYIYWIISALTRCATLRLVILHAAERTPERNARA